MGYGLPERRRHTPVSDGQIQLHIEQIVHWAVVVAGDLIKAKALIHANGSAEKGEGIQQHVPVSDCPRICNGSLCQGVPDFSPAKSRPDIQPLHFTAPGVKSPQANTSRRCAIPAGQIQSPIRPAIFGLQMLQLILVVLQLQILPEAGAALYQHLRIFRK